MGDRLVEPPAGAAGTDDERRRITRYITAGHVDGVLLVSSHSGDPLAARLREAGVPLPEDIAVGGFDDSSAALGATPN